MLAIFEENRYMLDIFSDLSKVFDIQLNTIHFKKLEFNGIKENNI